MAQGAEHKEQPGVLPDVLRHRSHDAVSAEQSTEADENPTTTISHHSASLGHVIVLASCEKSKHGTRSWTSRRERALVPSGVRTSAPSDAQTALASAIEMFLAIGAAAAAQTCPAASIVPGTVSLSVSLARCLSCAG
jgi:hypothetical protein